MREQSIEWWAWQYSAVFRLYSADVAVTGESRIMTLRVRMSTCGTDCVYTSMRAKWNASRTTFRRGLADPITF